MVEASWPLEGEGCFEEVWLNHLFPSTLQMCASGSERGRLGLRSPCKAAAVPGLEVALLTLHLGRHLGRFPGSQPEDTFLLKAEVLGFWKPSSLWSGCAIWQKSLGCWWLHAGSQGGELREIHYSLNMLCAGHFICSILDFIINTMEIIIAAISKSYYKIIQP